MKKADPSILTCFAAPGRTRIEPTVPAGGTGLCPQDLGGLALAPFATFGSKAGMYFKIRENATETRATINEFEPRTFGSCTGSLLSRFGSIGASERESASIAGMATITIRRLDETTKRRLRVRAADHGRSMEEEAREILKSAVAVRSSEAPNLVESVRRRLEPLGFVDLPEVPREPMRQPPPLDK